MQHSQLHRAGHGKDKPCAFEIHGDGRHTYPAINTLVAYKTVPSQAQKTASASNLKQRHVWRTHRHTTCRITSTHQKHTICVPQPNSCQKANSPTAVPSQHHVSSTAHTQATLTTQPRFSCSLTDEWTTIACSHCHTGSTLSPTQLLQTAAPFNNMLQLARPSPS